MDSNSNYIDRASLKFVLYARKSTEDEGSQVNSIEDQVRICKEYADRQGDINIVEVIEEKKSAKYSGNREKFSQMISDIRQGRLDGIIAYHPDRLARNMLEAGLIIDMLTPDKNRNKPPLKALIFPTGAYSNDSNGRLALAVTFSLATQYSEHLSEMVKRGTDSNLKKGISSGSPKWGYDRNIYGYYVPNKDFKLVRKGWDMILAGTTQKKVLDYWKKHGLTRQTKINKKNKSSRTISINKNSVRSILTEPFYYGILCQGGQEIDLRKIEGYNFKPMITEEEYNKVQTLLSNKKYKKRNLGNGKEFYPLRGMVYCAECGSLMYASVSKGHKGNRYGYYACQNKKCKRDHKSVRFKDVFEPLYDIVGSIKINKSTYDEYLAEIKNYTERELDEMRQERKSKAGALSQYKKKQKESAKQYAALKSDSTTPQSVLDISLNEIKELQNIIIDLESEIKELDKKLKDPNQIKLNLKEFSNLLKNAKNKMRAGTVVEKDQIARALFSNLKIDNQNKLTYLLNPELDGLIKTKKILNGEPGGTRTHDTKLKRLVL